jgi:starch synthase (maltosyl-transferring)
VYSKTAVDGGDPVLVVVNLDPYTAREGLLRLDLGALGLPGSSPYPVRDELTGATYSWSGYEPFVRLDPSVGQVAHVLALAPTGAAT